MKEMNKTKAERLRKASWQALGGGLLIAVFVAVWGALLTFLVSGGQLLGTIKIGPLPLFAVAAAVVFVAFIIDAIVLRISAHRHERRRLSKVAKRSIRKMKKKISDQTGVDSRRIRKQIRKKRKEAEKNRKDAEKSRKQKQKLLAKREKENMIRAKKARKAELKAEKYRFKRAKEENKSAYVEAKNRAKAAAKMATDKAKAVANKAKAGASGAINAMATGVYNTTERVKAGLQANKSAAKQDADEATGTVTTLDRVKTFVSRHPVLTVLLPVSIFACFFYPSYSVWCYRTYRIWRPYRYWIF